MPKLDLTITQGALSDEARQELPRKLGAALLAREGAPDTEFFRAITWAHLHELAPDTIQTPDGGAEPHAVVDVTVPEGALSDRRKGLLVEDVTRLVLEATGWSDEAALRVWTLIHEVPDGSGGAGGQVIRFAQLREAAKAEREKAGEKEEVPA
jgi:phenylpyruvate tautomerase PptA (4-oxalocrotonate tautomerase family)